MWSWYVCFRGTEGRVSMIPTVTLLSRLPTHVFPHRHLQQQHRILAVLSAREISAACRNGRKTKGIGRIAKKNRRKQGENGNVGVKFETTSTIFWCICRPLPQGTGDHDHGKTSDNFIILNLGEKWHLMGTGLPSYAGHEISSRFALLLVGI